MKKCVIGIVLVFVIIGGIVASGLFSASAFTTNIINNLTYSKTVNAGGYVVFSTHSSYKLGVVKYTPGTNPILRVYGIKSDDSAVELCSLGFPNGQYVCGGIDNNGAWVVFNQNRSQSGGTRLRFYFIKFSSNIPYYIDQFNLTESWSSFDWQFVCNNPPAFDLDFFGLIFHKRNSSFWGYAYGYFDNSDGTCHIDVSAISSTITAEPVGCLYALGGNILNTYSQKSYGIQDAMGTIAYQGTYSGPRVCAGFSQYVGNIQYHYGVNPDTLDFCMYNAYTLDSKVGLTPVPAVKGFFGGTPLMEEGVYDFNFSFGYSSANCCFFKNGGQQYWEFKITTGTTSSKVGNFWESYGDVASVDVQWLQERYESQDLHMSIEESIWQDYIGDVSITIPDISDTLLYVDDLFDNTSDINIAQFGQGLISSNAVRGNTSVFLGVVLLFGVGSLVAGLFL